MDPTAEQIATSIEAPLSAQSAVAVSVVIPLYNVEAYVEDCLGSLQKQTFNNWEAVCVDDASSDATLMRARKYAARDDRFRFIQHETNRGLSESRNSGLMAARGKYVVFLDSDDMLAPHALASLYTHAQAHKLDLVDFSYTTLYENDSLASMQGIAPVRKAVDGILSGQELMCAYTQLGQYRPEACLHFIRREFLNHIDLRFEPGIIHEDELFSPLLHAHAKRACFLNEDFYIRRVRTDSIITTKRGIKNVTSLHTVTTKLYSWITEHAPQCSLEFIDAFTQRIWLMREYMAHDILNCSGDELVLFHDSLLPEQRADFVLNGLQRAYELEQRENSKVWKLAGVLSNTANKLRGIAQLAKK